MSHLIRLEIGSTHVHETARCANASMAIEELFWNSLDADATKVSVRFKRDSLGIAESLRVTDNGVGIHINEVEEVFGKIGDSKKLRYRTTASGRVVHGSTGKGRLKALVSEVRLSGLLGIGIITFLRSSVFSCDRSEITHFSISQPISLPETPNLV